MSFRRKVRSLIPLSLLTVVGAACSNASAAPPEITVYATPTCSCCGGWMDHLRENGFTVNVVYRNDLSSVRAELKLPSELSSCHTGVVNGYAIEGHVPASTVHRLLQERPQILGIAAPGMPMGSPGMEVPGGAKQTYDVVSYNESGPVGVFETVQ